MRRLPEAFLPLRLLQLPPQRPPPPAAPPQRPGSVPEPPGGCQALGGPRGGARGLQQRHPPPARPRHGTAPSVPPRLGTEGPGVSDGEPLDLSLPKPAKEARPPQLRYEPFCPPTPLCPLFPAVLPSTLSHLLPAGVPRLHGTPALPAPHFLPLLLYPYGAAPKPAQAAGPWERHGPLAASGAGRPPLQAGGEPGGRRRLRRTPEGLYLCELCPKPSARAAPCCGTSTSTRGGARTAARSAPRPSSTSTTWPNTPGCTQASAPSSAPAAPAASPTPAPTRSTSTIARAAGPGAPPPPPGTPRPPPLRGPPPPVTRTAPCPLASRGRPRPLPSMGRLWPPNCRGRFQSPALPPAGRPPPSNCSCSRAPQTPTPCGHQDIRKTPPPTPCDSPICLEPRVTGHIPQLCQQAQRLRGVGDQGEGTGSPSQWGISPGPLPTSSTARQ
ncbi:uncharacterized protein LOC142818923 [Pelodiscus sinensis]|uniref:uncharacterized protein LOC142818923 n=1 Tax=Pelodiscus sinensis TaxID=13735 RepID=UPI003F6C0DBD